MTLPMHGPYPVEHPTGEAGVLEGGRLVGLLSRAHIMGCLHSRRELVF